MVRQPYMGFRVGTSYPKLRFLAEQSRTMDVAFSTPGDLFLEEPIGPAHTSVGGGGDAQLLFRLGTKPCWGECSVTTRTATSWVSTVVILSEHLWRARFGARTDVIGSEVDPQRAALRGDRGHAEGFPDGVVGLGRDHDRRLDPGGDGASRHEHEAKAWYKTPLALETPYSIIWDGLGRLRPGHTLAEARAEVALVSDEVQRQWPWPDVDAGRNVAFDVTRLGEDSVDPKVLHAVSLLRVAGGLVLILGGLNLASLFLARGWERSKTLGLHAVLGAPRLVLVGEPSRRL